MNHAIIVAAGNSTRMQGTNKIIAILGGKPVIAHTLDAFESCKDVHSITMVTQKPLFHELRSIVKKNNFKKVKNIVEGGKERQDSVLHGVSSLKNVKENDVLVIHNGSNPLVTIDEIASCIVEAKAHGASVCAFPLKDTIKKADGGFVKQTLDRSDVWQMQTPQCVQYGILKKAFDAAKKAKKYYTDDVALVEALDKKVKIVPCSTTNFKITTPDDLAMAEKLVANDKRTRQMSDSPGMRVGIGQDHHRFVQKGKKPLVLGGYVIPNEQGLDANSDGDIILHSLFNAISSALGGRSLSITADDMCKKGVTDSRKYLEPLLAEMKAQGYSLGNVSLSIEAKKPTLEPHHDKIKESLVHIVGILGNRIGLTFTTGEELTGMGRGEGMACSCMITLTK